MNAYTMLQTLLAIPERKDALFPPLDDEGNSLLLAGLADAIHLHADPEDAQGRFFVLYMPLLSLRGADGETERRFLWRLAGENMAGALPPGYALFGSVDDLSICLGGQFPVEGLEISALEILTDEFLRLGRALRERLLRGLEEDAARAAATIAPNAPGMSQKSANAQWLQV
ncbi:MAG: hypothetical protein LBO79_07365 [Zoogloeaceae bacterium]|jgi:hypothetical protein|nr:hypothetical protein [Zoogloeaceae bacterium]